MTLPPRRATRQARQGTSAETGTTEEDGEPGGSRVARFSKTKMCKFHLVGMCAKGPACPFAHGQEELAPLPDLTCTKLCKTLITTGNCTDPLCSYAHCKEELRATSTFHKTKMCRFSLNGFCAMGAKCNFAHNPNEIRNVDSPLAEVNVPMFNAPKAHQRGGFEPHGRTAPAGYPFSAAPAGQPRYLPSPSMPQHTAAEPPGRSRGRGAGGGGGGRTGARGGAPLAEPAAAALAESAAAAVPGQPRRRGGKRSGTSSQARAAAGPGGGCGAPVAAAAAPAAPGPAASEAFDHTAEISIGAALQESAGPDIGMPYTGGGPDMGMTFTGGGTEMSMSFSGGRLSRTSSGNALSSQDSPAYVMQTASGLVAADFGAVGRPLRAVRSAGARLNHLGGEPGGLLSDFGFSHGLAGCTPREETDTLVRGEPRQPRPCQGDHQAAGNEPSGAASACSSADGLTGSLGSSLGWGAAPLQGQKGHGQGEEVDQKGHVWQVKNTFLTYSPQVKPIRSVRTAEGALCRLGALSDDDGP